MYPFGLFFHRSNLPAYFEIKSVVSSELRKMEESRSGHWIQGVEFVQHGSGGMRAFDKPFFTMLTRAVIFFFVILAIAGFGYAQHSRAPGGPPVQDQDTVTRLQIYLDEHSFGPGKIDGRWGDFVGKAL